MYRKQPVGVPYYLLVRQRGTSSPVIGAPGQGHVDSSDQVAEAAVVRTLKPHSTERGRVRGLLKVEEGASLNLG